MSDRPRILAFDDEVQITTLLRDTLSLDGAEVLVANTAAEFHRLHGSSPVDIYILDLITPDGNGLNLVRELRTREDAGIIILTGQSSEVDVVLGLELGADDYIPKPFRPRELRARVASVYRRVAGKRAEQSAPQATEPALPDAPGDSINLGDWSIDVAARKVRHAAGERLELTTSEFDVLVYLARNAGRVVTRNQIIDAIRSENWAAYDRLIDGFVSRIRRKMLVIDPDRPLIRTIRGVGYCLSLDPD
ncbi:response regulator transcription factor [Halovulum dunhuangense]|uniref:Response regulator transcription factor n=1 Tax=Halovulum dunhuangense TaxID=1505036 RepID=A0A849L6Q5_9RHOB|nr:response regulator transcription factor [Halovulum dunhuangense]